MPQRTAVPPPERGDSSHRDAAGTRFHGCETNGGAGDSVATAHSVSGALGSVHTPSVLLQRDPLSILRECIVFILSNPQVYGTNVRELLDTELMYVMCVCASATATSDLGCTQVPLDMNSQTARLLPALSRAANRSGGGKTKGRGRLGSATHAADDSHRLPAAETAALPCAVAPTGNSALLPAIRKADGSASLGGEGSGTARLATLFHPASPRFIMSLQQNKGSEGQLRDLQGQWMTSTFKLTNEAELETCRPQGDRALLPTTAATTRIPTLPLAKSAASNRSPRPIQQSPSNTEAVALPRDSNAADLGLQGKAVGDLSHSAPASRVLDTPIGGSHVDVADQEALVDVGSYEIAFLRGELRRTSALFNASNIRTRELMLENEALRQKLGVESATVQQQEQQIRALEAQLASVIRDLSYVTEREQQVRAALASANAAVKEARRAGIPPPSSPAGSQEGGSNGNAKGDGAGKEFPLASLGREADPSPAARQANATSSDPVSAADSGGSTHDSKSGVNLPNDAELDIKGETPEEIRRYRLEMRKQYVSSELDRVTKVWRETERALQEANRRLENADHEIGLSHDHLRDAFGFIERLERRLARRDRRLRRESIRFGSLQEKYSKMRWCAMELATLTGVYSFADAMLSECPEVWFPMLYVKMHRRHFHYYLPTPSAFAEAVSTLSPLLRRFRRPRDDRLAMLTPLEGGGDGIPTGVRLLFEIHVAFVPSLLGGQLVSPHASSHLAGQVRLLLENCSSGYDPFGQPKDQKRTNLHGIVACRALRWETPFSIDYFGGQETLEDLLITRRTIPLLTLASVIIQPTTPVFPSVDCQSVLEGNASGLPGSLTAEVGEKKKSGVSIVAEEGNGQPLAETGASKLAGMKPLEYQGATDKLNLQRAHIRLLLCYFWEERYRQYAELMDYRQRLIQKETGVCRESCAETCVESAAQLVSRERSLSAIVDGKENKESAPPAVAAEGDPSEFAPQPSDTFLSAFVAFVDGLYPPIPENEDDDTKSSGHGTMKGNAAGDGVPQSPAHQDAHFSHPNERRWTLASSDATETDGLQLGRTIVGDILPVDEAAAKKPMVGDGSGANTSRRQSTRASATVNAAAPIFGANVENMGDGLGANLPSVNPVRRSGGNVLFAQWATTSDFKSIEPLSRLSARAREVLRCVYLFAMEYKEVDVDLRLFFLVAHQLLPESIAINFFASIQAIHLECEKAVAQGVATAFPTSSTVNDEDVVAPPTSTRLQKSTFTLMQRKPEPLSPRRASGTSNVGEESKVGKQRGWVPGAQHRAESNALEDDSPITILQRAMELVDRAPLCYENPDVEPDSDGDGYGCVLASTLEATEVPPDASRIVLHGISQFLEVGALRRGTTGRVSVKRSAKQVRMDQSCASQCKQSLTPCESPENEVDTCTTFDLSESSGGVAAAKAGPVESGSVGGEVRQPNQDPKGLEADPWVHMQRSLKERFGGRKPFLASLVSEVTRGNDAATESYVETLSRRERNQLAAARGLLPIDTVLSILWKYSFAAFAVSLCGGDRHYPVCRSLLSAEGGFCDPEDDKWLPRGQSEQGVASKLHPLSVVGGVVQRLSAVARRRLHFALSLDQPSALIQYDKLFSVEVSCRATPTHLYDELLTLLLDAVQDQQKQWIANVLVGSCRSCHEQHAAQGMEVCEGSIPLEAFTARVTEHLRRNAMALVDSDEYRSLVKEEATSTAAGVPRDVAPADLPSALATPPQEGATITRGTTSRPSPLPSPRRTMKTPGTASDPQEKPTPPSSCAVSCSLSTPMTKVDAVSHSWAGIAASHIVGHVTRHARKMEDMEDYRLRQFIDIPILVSPALSQATAVVPKADRERKPVSLQHAAYVLRMAFFVWPTQPWKKSGQGYATASSTNGGTLAEVAEAPGTPSSRATIGVSRTTLSPLANTLSSFAPLSPRKVAEICHRTKGEDAASEVALLVGESTDEGAFSSEVKAQYHDALQRTTKSAALKSSLRAMFSALVMRPVEQCKNVQRQSRSRTQKSSTSPLKRVVSTNSSTYAGGKKSSVRRSSSTTVVEACTVPAPIVSPLESAARLLQDDFQPPETVMSNTISGSMEKERHRQLCKTLIAAMLPYFSHAGSTVPLYGEPRLTAAATATGPVHRQRGSRSSAEKSRGPRRSTSTASSGGTVVEGGELVPEPRQKRFDTDSTVLLGLANIAADMRGPPPGSFNQVLSRSMFELDRFVTATASHELCDTSTVRGALPSKSGRGPSPSGGAIRGDKKLGKKHAAGKALRAGAGLGAMAPTGSIEQVLNALAMPVASAAELEQVAAGLPRGELWHNAVAELQRSLLRPINPMPIVGRFHTVAADMSASYHPLAKQLLVDGINIAPSAAASAGILPRQVPELASLSLMTGETVKAEALFDPSPKMPEKRSNSTATGVEELSGRLRTVQNALGHLQADEVNTDSSVKLLKLIQMQCCIMSVFSQHPV